MKRFLTLTALSLLLVNSAPLYLQHDSNLQLKTANNIKNNYDEPTNLLSVSKIVDKITSESDDFVSWKEQDNDVRIKSGTEKIWQQFNSYVDNNNLTTGVLTSLNVYPISEQVIHTYVDSITNNSDTESKLATHEYSNTITNTSKFSIKLSESISVKVKFNFVFGAATVAGELSSSQEWTDSKSDSETVVSKAQEFTVKPHSKGVAKTIIKQGTYRSIGEIKYFTDDKLNLESNTYIAKDGKEYSLFVPIAGENGIISKLAKDGYADFLKTDAKKYAVFGADNPLNPVNYSINLPIKWTSQGGETDVVYDNV